ncbi:MAG: electron transport complex subunit RsxE [Candidatus Omnitrophica bacterium CG08_land_8_20_14_0_20_41_16]|uniref:Ion-translocating oxidoreductase complex subunit E n=1 Tax=Candidatus Sherwoodlollariibacterium unditelluris TaxID=1974757 RepID=A0A2G9YJY2_9BACT|nr:MAG: electron transport complex subunit RsxE [Candidatus Omnitrophica bacterium CG23_combo_of_CG06-09_8_20_14_all_41_10]PIS33384.1 MAG: electron transport complex subunit RsxE [Candidatus Omnitrophica bacterium CG08_land_8_20_14_0_20_41_16]
MKKYFYEFSKGIIRENPTFVLVLGLCPTLAVSISVINGIGMGIAATFVLLGSNIIISLIKTVIPDRIRIPCFIVVIATFVTIVEMTMKAYSPALNRALGIYVPLIVVNCIVLGRVEAYAQKATVVNSFFDGLGMGLGFTLALILISGIREFLGAGKILGHTLFKGFEPAFVLGMPSGALLAIGLLLGFFNLIKMRKTCK